MDSGRVCGVTRESHRSQEGTTPRIITSTHLTLDGVIENPAWTMPYFDDEAAAFAGEQTDAADALLMGRRTYDGFAAAWPNMVVTHALVQAGLVDEVRFWIHPVLQGGPSVSAPLGQLPTTFALADSRVMKSGVIIASYRPVSG